MFPSSQTIPLCSVVWSRPHLPHQTKTFSDHRKNSTIQYIVWVLELYASGASDNTLNRSYFFWVIARATGQRVTKEDQLLPMVKSKMQEFNQKVKEKLDNKHHREEHPAEGLTLDNEDFNDEKEPKAKQDDYTDEAYDAYLGAKLLVPCGDNFIVGRVTKQV